MIWNKKLPEWRASGTEPPESLKEEGFTAGYKPPAPYFNWLFHTIYEAVQEIRNALKEIAVTGKAADLQEDSEHRLVSDTEKTAWNGKASGNHTHNSMTAATASAAGEAGLVPAPAAGAQAKYLRGDGTWQTPPDTNTTYSAATQSANGLMSAADKTKLDGIAEKANNYSHPTSAGSKHIPAGGSAGQILRWLADGTAIWGNDNNTTYSNMTAASANAAGKAGLVPAPAAGAQGKYLRGDGTWQTPPDTNTTYSAATQSANGLMSAADKKKLDGVAEKANNYSFPSRYPNSTLVGGASTCVASGQYAFAFGNGAKATGTHSAAFSGTASGLASFSAPWGQAKGDGSFACGGSEADGAYCVAMGCEAYADYYDSAIGYRVSNIGAQGSLVIGRDNDVKASTASSAMFVVGNGYYSKYNKNDANPDYTGGSNAFRVTSSGAVYGKSAYNTSGADYAEFFEWLDGNPEAEDRRGYFVTLDGDKIRLANSDDDYILGVISGRPSVIGNSDPDDWHGHFACDEFGEFIMEKAIDKRPILREETYTDEETGEEKTRIVEDYEEIEVDVYVLNPDFDPDRPYTPRSERPEWAAVGMLGVLLVRDDGTCQVNGYCKVADGGIATASETGWRVIARVNEHLVKIVFK